MNKQPCIITFHLAFHATKFALCVSALYRISSLPEYLQITCLISFHHLDLIMMCKLVGFLLVTVVASTPFKFNDLGESIKNISQPVFNGSTHYSTAPLLGTELPEIIPDEYIVVFESVDRVSSEQGSLMHS